MNRSWTQTKLHIPSKTEPTLKELTTFYKKDKRIFHFLQKDDVSEHRKTQKHIRSESHSLLKRINSLFNIKRDLSFQHNQYDNRKFINDFQKAKKQEHLKPPKEAFKYLIKEYTQRGYKIPSFSLRHNLFNPSPLAENKKRRLINTFIVVDKKRKHKMKKNSLKYLKKIKDMVTELIQFYKKEKSDLNNFLSNKPRTSIFPPNQQKITSTKNPKLQEQNEESTPKLLKQIAKLLNMINETINDKLLNQSKPNRKRIISDLNNPFNETEPNITQYIKPKRQSAIINFKRNSNFPQKPIRSTIKQPHIDIRQIKKSTFDLMNIHNLTNRSGNDCKNTTSISEYSNTVPFFLSPSSKPAPNPFPPGVNSFMGDSPSTRKRKTNSILSHSNFQIQTASTKRKTNSNIKSFASYSDVSNISQSTNFKTFKNGLGLGIGIKANFKTQSDLIGFAYERCKENDFPSVKTALRILLEKFKEMNVYQVEKYFDELFNSAESNVIIKQIDITKKIMNKTNIEQKIKQLYTTDVLKESVKPKLHMLQSKNRELNKIDKQFVKSIINKSNIK